jgi:hypothetical protein
MSAFPEQHSKATKLNPSVPSHEGFFVGSRVRDGDGFRATVRYIGTVAAAKNKEEIWLGVEWDDATRGKHDGSCVDDQGILHRYFECVYGAGSFVKLNKVNTGRSLVEALQDRYVSIDAPTIVEPDGRLPDGQFNTSKGNQKSIEFYGEKKLRYILYFVCCHSFDYSCPCYFEDIVSNFRRWIKLLCGMMQLAKLAMD